MRFPFVRDETSMERPLTILFTSDGLVLEKKGFSIRMSNVDFARNPVGHPVAGSWPPPFRKLRQPCVIVHGRRQRFEKIPGPKTRSGSQKRSARIAKF
jgi:hypothetical protein